MRLLAVHAWMKGNLGDVLQLTVLLEALRELRPRVLDSFAGDDFPAERAKIRRHGIGGVRRSGARDVRRRGLVGGDITGGAADLAQVFARSEGSGK